MKEGLTDNKGLGIVKYIIEEDLKNNEYTSKQIRKNLKKINDINGRRTIHLPKKNPKNKIKSFFKNYTIGLFKGKSKYYKRNCWTKDKFELEKKIRRITIKTRFELKVNKDRRTNDTSSSSRESEHSGSGSQLNKNPHPDPYKVYWNDILVRNWIKKNKSLPLIPVLEDKSKNIYL